MKMRMNVSLRMKTRMKMRVTVRAGVRMKTRMKMRMRTRMTNRNWCLVVDLVAPLMPVELQYGAPWQWPIPFQSLISIPDAVDIVESSMADQMLHLLQRVVRK